MTRNLLDYADEEIAYEEIVEAAFFWASTP